MIQNSNGDFREASRRSAALTEVIRDGGAAVSGVVQEKTVLDNPIPDMAAVELINCYCSIVYLQYKDILLYTPRYMLCGTNCHMSHTYTLLLNTRGVIKAR